MTALTIDPAAPLGVRDAARATGVSVDTIRREIRAGRLPASQPGGQRKIVILPADLQAWFDAGRLHSAPAPDASPRLRASSEGGPTAAHRRAQTSRRARAPGSVDRLLEIEAGG